MVMVMLENSHNDKLRFNDLISFSGVSHKRNDKVTSETASPCIINDAMTDYNILRVRVSL